jgi:hypothetical protein
LSGSRQRLQLRAPQGGLEGFPGWTLRRNRRLYRAHHADRCPWWFSSDGSNRFDLPTPNGTCYLASDTESAVRERWGEELIGLGFVPYAVAATTVASALTVPSGGKVADCTAREAAKHRVSREIGTTGDYQITQRWAEALGPDGAGFSGMRYQPRFSTDSRTWALGLFGDAGERADWMTDPSPRSGFAIAADLGIKVAEPPTVGELTADGVLHDEV